MTFPIAEITEHRDEKCELKCIRVRGMVETYVVVRKDIETGKEQTMEFTGLDEIKDLRVILGEMIEREETTDDQ